MRIVGIDPSLSRTGVCILADDCEPEFHSIVPKGRNLTLFQKQMKIVSSLRKLLVENDVVVLEDFGLSARYAPSGRFVERIELCGMIKLIAPSITGLPWLSIVPTMLKSFVTGKSSAHKEEVVESVKTKWGANPLNNDEADAFGLARYAQAVLTNDMSFGAKIQKFTSYGQNVSNLPQIRFIFGGKKT